MLVIPLLKYLPSPTPPTKDLLALFKSQTPNHSSCSRLRAIAWFAASDCLQSPTPQTRILLFRRLSPSSPNTCATVPTYFLRDFCRPFTRSQKFNSHHLRTTTRFVASKPSALFTAVATLGQPPLVAHTFRDSIDRERECIVDTTSRSISRSPRSLQEEVQSEIIA